MLLHQELQKVRAVIPGVADGLCLSYQETEGSYRNA
jgi:hypothetical protein